jgi:hypothetical protein
MQPFPIAQYQTGLFTTIAPFLIPPDGFTTLSNMHIKDARVEKRQGYRTIGYTAHHPTTLTTDGDTISTITQASPAVVTTTAAHNFTTGNQVVILGGGMLEVVSQRFTITVTGANTFSLNGIDSTAYTTYSPGGKVYQSPSLRVMGLTTYLTANGEEKSIGWDSERAWIWSSTYEGFIPLDNSGGSPADYLSGGKYDFISYAQWNTALAGNNLYFVNGLLLSGSANGIQTYNEASSPPIAVYTPQIDDAGTPSFLYGAKGIAVFKGRLLFFSTFEGTSAGSKPNYPQRVRWCRINDPRTAGDQWKQDIPGNGGFADAATQDQYIGHEVLQNEIIVRFTNSIYALRYQPDPVEPFRWQKLNSFVSNKARHGSTAYDGFCVFLGDKGIYGCNGNESSRLDDKIDDYIGENFNKSEFKLAYGKRDYIFNRSIFLYPQDESEENNAALVRDDDTGAYSSYTIDLNVLGDGTNPYPELLMSDFPESDEANPKNLPLYGYQAENDTWMNYVWDAGEEALFGGKIDGSIVQLNYDNSEDGQNINSECTTGLLNPFRDQGLECNLGYIDFYCESDPITKVRILVYKNSIVYPYKDVTMNLLGNLGELATVTNIVVKSPATDGIIVTAPGHGLIDGQTLYMYGVRGMTGVNNTKFTASNVTENGFDVAVDATTYIAYTAGGIVCLKEYKQDKIYKRIVVGEVGTGHQIRLAIEENESAFILHSMIPYFKPVKGRMI